jgi:nitrogen-specific signal transduction histidine kinase
MQEMIEALAQFDLFAELPSENLAEISHLAQEETFPDGVVLFSEDAPAEKLYLVLSGKVSLEKRVQLGRTGTPRNAVISIVGPGHTLGWSSLVHPYEYTSSGTCLGKVKLLTIPGENLRQWMAQNPSIGFTICHRVASIVRERMTNATSSLTYFLSIVSHELKRPLAAVENYLQILLGGYAGELTPKQTRLLERSTLRLIDLRNLISDIIDFARIQPEQIRADFEWVEPSEIGSEAIEDVRLAASQKNINLKATAPTEFQPIFAARRRLRQVISNLLANAVKFSPEGSTVTLAAHDHPDALVIEVMDEGIGIPKEDQLHIFDDFFRARNVTEFGGAGLGLSIAQKIVEAHQGAITVESPFQVGKSGTRFTVTIPKTSTPPGEQTSPEKQVKNGRQNSEKETFSTLEGGQT